MMIKLSFSISNLKLELVQGIGWGLSALGLSRLGALRGLAHHHPLQSFDATIKSGNSRVILVTDK